MANDDLKEHERAVRLDILANLVTQMRRHHRQEADESDDSDDGIDHSVFQVFSPWPVFKKGPKRRKNNT